MEVSVPILVPIQRPQCSYISLILSKVAIQWPNRKLRSCHRDKEVICFTVHAQPCDPKLQPWSSRPWIPRPCNSCHVQGEHWPSSIFQHQYYPENCHWKFKEVEKVKQTQIVNWFLHIFITWFKIATFVWLSDILHEKWWLDQKYRTRITILGLGAMFLLGMFVVRLSQTVTRTNAKIENFSMILEKETPN